MLDTYGRLTHVVPPEGTIVSGTPTAGYIEYSYDARGNITQEKQVAKSGSGLANLLLWYEGSGTSDRRWLHADERGSIIAVTNGSGTSLATNAYGEDGIPQSTNLGRFQYTGQTWIPELRLYHYKARMYSSTLGRFLQTDPIGYADGMNLYAYVGNDPVNATDPMGLDQCPPGAEEGDICVDGHRVKNGPVPGGLLQLVPRI